jgi:hypothetical protein
MIQNFKAHPYWLILILTDLIQNPRIRYFSLSEQNLYRTDWEPLTKQL